MSKGKLEWGRILKKLSPYTIQKGYRYLKHYGPKEFWIRLHERFEPEEVPYGPWYEAYRPTEADLDKQRKRVWKYSPKISIVVPAYKRADLQQLGTVYSQCQSGRCLHGIYAERIFLF